MSWVAVAVAGSATVSYLNNQAAKKRESDNMQANADAIRYSPWSGMKPQMMGKKAGTSDMAAILGGGLQGGMFASQFKGAKPDASGPTGGGEASTGDNMVGGQDMGNQLKSQGTAFDTQMKQNYPNAFPQAAPQQPMIPPMQAPESMAANSPAFGMDMSNGAQPGSQWPSMLQKRNFYSR